MSQRKPFNDASNANIPNDHTDDVARAGAEILARLATKRRIGAAHCNEKHLRNALPRALRAQYSPAIRVLRAHGWLIFHAKGRPGKDDQVSLTPATMREALAWAWPHLSSERCARVKAVFHGTLPPGWTSGWQPEGVAGGAC